ncbi:MAG: DUF1553 domain-containing protein, partial [Phycisphaerae bacterium]|nr:DUF1553 domain-containing protein [Phycisphaerae bacterium]
NEINAIKKRQKSIEDEIKKLGGPRLQELTEQLAEIREQTKGLRKPAEHGWHSRMVAKPDTVKWVQVDLGEARAFDRVVLRACYDDFARIGAGFGFPVRFKVECSDDPNFSRGVITLRDATQADIPNPKLRPVEITVQGIRGRYVRVTATKLFHRVDSYMVALSEMQVLSGSANLAAGKTVTSLDSIQAPIRWRRSNLVDGKYPTQREAEDPALAARVEREHAALMAKLQDDKLNTRRVDLSKSLKNKETALKRLPTGKKVYAGTVHKGSGNFRGRLGLGPREIRILHRGDVTQPGDPVEPGVLPLIPGESWRLPAANRRDDKTRRAALAKWLTRKDHPLTWRSIVNRVWLYHFGRGLADSPNDFGRMGQPPSHPELLDWLAVEFRDGGQSFKSLHELIVTSAAYRQASTHREDYAAIDGDNKYLWRANRRRLDAESLRDSVLTVSGKLDRKMYGPGFRLFALEKATHSPHYEYHKHDPEDPLSHRRAIYRFIVRSQPDPFLTTLDCADSSQSTPRRTETITALQALSLLNNKFNLAMAKHFAERLEAEAPDLPGRVARAHRLATGREPSAGRLVALTGYAKAHGLANLCRLLFNLNEFIYVD